MSTNVFRIGRMFGLLMMLAVIMGLFACEPGSAEDRRARELGQIRRAWADIQQALDAGNLAQLRAAFHPRVLQDYAKAPEIMVKIRANSELADLVRGEIRAAIIDPPLALVSTATDALLETPTDWVWVKTPTGWKLVGNRDAVHLLNLVNGTGPLLRQDE